MVLGKPTTGSYIQKLLSFNKQCMKFSKVLRSIIIGYFLTIGLSACNQDQYVEYRPHYLSKNSAHKSFGEPTLDSAEYKNTIQVLEYYGEDFKTKDENVILISKALSKDWELVWNYTTKANDEDWLATHSKK